MLTRVYPILVLFLAIPVWSQAITEPTDAPASAEIEIRMQVPPPISGEAYPATLGVEARSNYLYAGFGFSTAYDDNVLAGTSPYPIRDVIYCISPSILLNETTPRLRQRYSYTPGFTFYQHTSERNEEDHDLDADVRYRLSPNISATLQDSFRKSSNAFDEAYTSPEGTISGSTQVSPVTLVVPIADQLSNVANVGLNYQFGTDSMTGASGTFTNLEYPNPKQVPGLYNSSSLGGQAFYSHRASARLYLGAAYQYSQISSSPLSNANATENNAGSEVDTNAALFFGTVYLKPNLSFSVSSGPQHYDVSQAPFLPERSWVPAVTASMGWQGNRTNFAASYSKAVTGGGGLLGAFNSNSAFASARSQIARTWTLGTSASYAITQNVSQNMAATNPGGHMISGSISVEHPLSAHFLIQAGYMHLHEAYDSIEVISNAPDSNREYISITYRLTRPIGK